jgi:hypothetical protein
MSAMGGIPTTLVTGSRARDREAAIAAALAPGLSAGIILEGLAEAVSPLAENAGGALELRRIAPGCLCCAGNLVLRVTLNRLLRRPPVQLFISLANAEHLERLREMLCSEPYGALLALRPDLSA